MNEYQSEVIFLLHNYQLDQHIAIELFRHQHTLIRQGIREDVVIAI